MTRPDLLSPWWHKAAYAALGYVACLLTAGPVSCFHPSCGQTPSDCPAPLPPQIVYVPAEPTRGLPMMPTKDTNLRAAIDRLNHALDCADCTIPKEPNK